MGGKRLLFLLISSLLRLAGGAGLGMRYTQWSAEPALELEAAELELEVEPPSPRR